MDRVNRRFFVASAAIAIPTALLMVSLSIGTTPEMPDPQWIGPADGSVATTAILGELSPGNPQIALTGGTLSDDGVQLAVGTGDVGEIAQVVGKQPHTHPRRHTQTAKKSKAKKPSRGLGLFEGWFGGRSSNQSRHDDNIERRLTASTTNDSDVSWDGIPYHDVKRKSNSSRDRTATASRSSRSLAAPIRSKSTASTPTRTIRGGSRPAMRSPQPVNRVSRPKLARAPSPALAIPKPPRETSSSTRSAINEIANDRSTRRDRNKTATKKQNMLNIAKIYSGPEDSIADYNNDDVADLVPRVSRRAIKTSPEPTKVAAKPAKRAKKTIAALPVGKAKPAHVAKPLKVAKPAETPKASTALAKTKAQPSKPLVKLETPQVAVSNKPGAGYSKPVNPQTTPVPTPPAFKEPTGLVPVPSAVVAHRNNATPSVPTHPLGRFAATPIQQPAAQDNFSAVGSGLRTRAGLASPTSRPYQARQPAPAMNERTPFGTPEHHTAQLDPTDRNAPQRFSDPYQRDTNRPRFATTGQRNAGQDQNSARMAIDSLTNDQGTPTRSREANSAFPMREIPGYQGENSGSDISSGMITRRSSSTPQPLAGSDSFEPVPYGSRNQMRGTASAIAKMPSEQAQIVASELPGIRVVTHGPSEVMIRQTNEYEIRVENRGSIDAEGVLVRVHIPDWADVQGHNATRGSLDDQQDNDANRMAWTIDHLPAGATEQLFVRLMAARSGTHNLDVDWTLVPQKSVAQVHVREPELQLKIEGPDSIVYGESQTYKVRVLNPGDGVAPSVVFTLSPNSATPQSQKIGDIPAGKEAQFEVELTAQDLGELKIQGLATGDFELRSEAKKTIRVAAAKLEAVIAGPELQYKDTEAFYNLQVENLGDATSKNVVAVLRIPSGVKYLGGIEGATVQRGILKWNLAEVAPGMSREYQFKCSMNATGAHLFAFDCKGSAAGQATVSIETQVESIADLVLEINDPTAPAPIGQEITYEIVIRNRGSREAKEVRAIAQFSHGIEPRRVEGQSGEVVTGQVLFDPIPRIGPGEEVRLRIVAEAERAGHHRFRTEVRSGDTVLVAEEATHFMSPRSDRVSHRSSDQSMTR